MHLFIDDLRNPPSRKWVVARTMAAVEWHIENVGMPVSISFDHDLGEGQPSGYDIAHMLVNKHLDGHIDITKVNDIIIHSANPVGARNIHALMYSFYHFLVSEGEVSTIPSINWFPRI